MCFSLQRSKDINPSCCLEAPSPTATFPSPPGVDAPALPPSPCPASPALQPVCPHTTLPSFELPIAAHSTGSDIKTKPEGCASCWELGFPPGLREPLRVPRSVDSHGPFVFQLCPQKTDLHFQDCVALHWRYTHTLRKMWAERRVSSHVIWSNPGKHMLSKMPGTAFHGCCTSTVWAETVAVHKAGASQVSQSGLSLLLLAKDFLAKEEESPHSLKKYLLWPLEPAGDMTFIFHQFTFRKYWKHAFPIFGTLWAISWKLLCRAKGFSDTLSQGVFLPQGPETTSAVAAGEMRKPSACFGEENRTKRASWKRKLQS